MSKIKFKKSVVITLATLAGLVLLVSGGIFFLLHDPAGAATFTDNVLRPLIGDRAVIRLERVVFSAQDAVKRFEQKPPDTASFAATVKTVPVTFPSVSPSSEPSSSPTGSASPAAAPLTPATNIQPYVDTAEPLSGEGVWRNISGTNFVTTFIRTDSERPFSVVNLVKIPMNGLSIGTVAGLKHPGGEANLLGPGRVPQSIQDSGQLVAAFNGGFQEKDGHFGMYANGTTYVPLRQYLATLYIYQDGHPALVNYSGTLPANVVAARQNGLMLVANHQTTSQTTRGVDLWAGTAKGGYVTWRSGLGITDNGDLVYAVGPSLTPTSLANALRLAGSKDAMQLDINEFWVRFMIYSWSGGHYTWSTLVKDLANGGQAYLSGYDKDFFYIYKKP